MTADTATPQRSGQLSARVLDWIAHEQVAVLDARDRHVLAGLDGDCYLFDTRSGLSVQLNGPAALLVEALLASPHRAHALAAEVSARYSEADVRQAMAECSQLLELLRRQQTPPPAPEQARPGYNLSLNAGMACNLACTYCDPLGYRRKTRGQSMSEQTARQALDFFFAQLPPDQTGCVTYSIGGEPLLYRRLLDTVAAYTSDLRDRGIRATQYLSTNGLLLSDGTLEYLRVSGLNFGLSLDGPPQAHDACRVGPDGRPTAAAATAAAQKVLDRFPHTTVSAVLTAHFPHPLAVYRHLLDLGFQRIIVKPVRARPQEPHAFTPENLHVLQDGYREYARFFAGALAEGRREIFAAINPHDYFARFVLRVFRREKHAYRCGAASMANLTVAPDGSFYPCEGFVGQEEYRLGDVTSGFNEAAMARFAALYVDEKPGCQDCWARYLCGGGCYLLGLMVNGDIATPDPAECELTRFLVEQAIGVLHEVQRRRPEALAELKAWCDTQGWYGKETVIARMVAAKPERIELPMLGDEREVDPQMMQMIADG
jgi:uncharacterized protein